VTGSFFGKDPWGRMVLDEAQFIKNPQAKQSQAVRAFPAPRRIALTGTPVENRLSELWSIMDFLNPGYLGRGATFRRRSSPCPIERTATRQDGAAAGPSCARSSCAVSRPTRPWWPTSPRSSRAASSASSPASRRRSTSPASSGCSRTVDAAEGIHRRGLVLSSLIKLKQICNHPAQALKDFEDPNAGRIPDPSRSGKCVRLLEMLDEILSEGDQALIFTQFRQMGHLLSLMLRHELDREVLFLHGGTPQGQRQHDRRPSRRPRA
jgi:SNF2 family DNA or RNA helicase